MSIDVEYAIRKDIRNNPVVREVDAHERKEFRRTLLLATLCVALVLFSAFQHFRILRSGYDGESLRREIAAEQVINRQLHLNLETQRAPQQIEKRARDLGLVPPALADTVVIERVPMTSPSGAVVAQAR
ncbi:MAG: hypothetical protein ABI652_05485 [Acidobacteriota bacterium]